jgi:alanyl-tRNA synthetase
MHACGGHDDTCVVLQAKDVNGSKVLVARLEDVDGGALQKAAESISEALGDPSAVVLASAPAGGGKVVLVTAFSETLVKERKMNAGRFVGSLAKICGGGGGGKPGMAQAGGKNAEKLPEALAEAESQLQEALGS